MKFLSNFFSIPMHLVLIVVLTYSLITGHVDYREYLLIAGFLVLFSVIGATKPLWKNEK